MQDECVSPLLHFSKSYKGEFRFVGLLPSGQWHFSNAGETDCHGLRPRNDKLIDTKSAYFTAKCAENCVIANQSADWCGDPFP